MNENPKYIVCSCVSTPKYSPGTSSIDIHLRPLPSPSANLDILNHSGYISHVSRSLSDSWSSDSLSPGASPARASVNEKAETSHVGYLQVEFLTHMIMINEHHKAAVLGH